MTGRSFACAWPRHAQAAGEAWWTGQASLTINRRSRPAPGSAQVAQLVEHATENRSVGGSIPPLGTIDINNLARVEEKPKAGVSTEHRDIEVRRIPTSR